MNQETEDAREKSAAASSLREVSKEHLKEKLYGHKQWLDSDGKLGNAADFSHSNLRGVNLLGADLRGANLEGAYLYGAYLKNACLENANLAGANLRGANLRWANLKYANLRGANLVRADIKEADFQEARMEGANFNMVSGLSRKQIEAAHTGPDTVLPKEFRENKITDG